MGRREVGNRDEGREREGRERHGERDDRSGRRRRSRSVSGSPDVLDRPSRKRRDDRDGRVDQDRRHSRDERDDRDRRNRDLSHDHDRRDGRDKKEKLAVVPVKPVKLAFEAKVLTMSSIKSRQKLFGLYLELEKGIDIRVLTDREIQGRWKSFIRKWNYGQLATNWYDPAIVSEIRSTRREDHGWPDEEDDSAGEEDDRDDQAEDEQPMLRPKKSGADSDSDDSIGPSIPHDQPPSGQSKLVSGPSAPKVDDLRYRDDLIAADIRTGRADEAESRFQKRMADKALAKQWLDETAPRAEPNTRERQIENRQLRAQANREFAAAREPGGGAGNELPDEDVMGAGDGDRLTRMKELERERSRKKTDRQLRRDEIFKAQAAERQERLASAKAREDKTMDMLKALARSRFG